MNGKKSKLRITGRLTVTVPCMCDALIEFDLTDADRSVERAASFEKQTACVNCLATVDVTVGLSSHIEAKAKKVEG